MKKFLNKKISKTIPLWSVIAILMTAGVAYGAFTYISNRQTKSVDVSLWEIELNTPSGSFTGLHPEETPQTVWPYVVNDDQNSDGYVIITFTFTEAPTLGDVTVSSVNIEGGAFLVPITDYPKVSGTNLEFVYGSTDSSGYDFGATSAGNIWISWTPHTPDVNIMSVRIASALV
jgi:hypothetical protein